MPYACGTRSQHIFRLTHETQTLYKKTGFFASPMQADLRCGNERRNEAT